MNNTDRIIKRRYSTSPDGTRHCLITYRRIDGTKYTVQSY